MQTTSEIVDLTVKGGNMCNNWPDFIPYLGGVVKPIGGLIGDTVIICGGSQTYSLTGCYSLTSEKATLVTHMSFDRGDPASIVLNGNALWITGGYVASGQIVNSTAVQIQVLQRPSVEFSVKFFFIRIAHLKLNLTSTKSLCCSQVNLVCL